MMKRKLVRYSLLGALLFATAQAAAIDRDGAAAAVQQSTGGRVLAVDRGEKDGQPVFRVKVLTPSGDVRIVIVDAKTGALR